MKKTSDIVAEAQREIDEENKRDKIEDAKAVLRQIESLKRVLKDLNRQIKEM